MMKSRSDESALNITHVGAAARGHLTPGQTGKVLAVLSNAIYLLTASGELVWLASDGAAMHRRCLRVSAPLPRPGEWASFCVDDHWLRIDPGFVLDSAAASLWQPPRVSRDQVVTITEVAARVRDVVSGLDLAEARGFGRFIPDIVGCGPGFAATPDDLVLTRAKPIVLSVADACLRQDRDRIALDAGALIGLGSGLTPSGDDFLGGLLFGARALLDAYPDLRVFNMGITVEPYRARTNQISLTLLDDLAQGHAIEPMHRIISGILSGESVQETHLAIAQLTRVGHSTGWDMLAGLFTGLLMTHKGNRLPAQVAQSGQT